MKKSVWFGMLLAMCSTTIISCKKEYNCQCTKEYTHNDGTISYQEEIHTYKDIEIKAEKKCYNEEGNGNDSGGNYSKTCKIK